MGLVDTAKLVASLELQDKFSRTANKFDQTVGGLERRTSTLGRIGGQVGAGIGAATQNLTRIGLIGAGVLAANVAAGIASLNRLEEVTAQTNAVIESTGGIAGITADKVRALAEEYESLNATMDDKVIQSGENLLLTFTNINEKAFEPALQAALDMNEAMGGGEEGLQNTIIMIGKALQDPIRGFTALRRVGVNLTQQQKEQIKTLVAQNDLYGAQQIILQELGTEFGGSFAAAGDTATAKFAKLRDAVEDAQQALAIALLPAIEKVTDKLSEILADPRTIAQIKDLGTNLADAFDDLVEFAGNLPWDSIKSAFQIMGTGSKALLDAFTGLPPWVQTAVLTGWGLNKLTGGALTGIAGTLAGAIGRGIFGTRGATPANPLFVSNVGGAPLGGAPGAGGGGFLGGLAGGVVAGTGAAATTAGGILTIQDITSGTESGVKRGFAAASGGFVGLISRAIEEVIGDPLGDLLNGQTKQTRDTSAAVREGDRSIIQKTDGLIGKVNDARLAQIRDNAQSRQFLANIRAETAAGSSRILAGVDRTSAAIRAKKLSTTVKVNVTSSVSISEIQRRITSQQLAIGTGFQEF